MYIRDMRTTDLAWIFCSSIIMPFASYLAAETAMPTDGYGV